MEWPPFEPDWVTDEGDGTFKVEVLAPGESPNGLLGECTIGGTITSPEISFRFVELG